MPADAEGSFPEPFSTCSSSSFSASLPQQLLSLQAPAGGMTRAQLHVLNEVLTGLFGVSEEAAFLPDIMRKLGQRGIHVSSEAVVAVLEAASSAEYDELPAEQRWSQRLIWDANDQSVCAL
jgi:hypothetical protein